MGTSTRNHTKYIAGVMAAVFMIAGMASLHSEDTKSNKAKAGKAAADTKKTDAKKSDGNDAAAKKSSGRLPRNYGKLDLSDEQRDKIYAIQSKTADQLESLRKQLQTLQDKRDQEVEGVLTDAQKTRLKELNSDSESGRKKGGPGSRAARKAADEKKGTEPTTEKKK